MKRPLYIFDLDGTLALIGHRRHFVENRANRWKEFFEACVDDMPNFAVIDTMNRLRRTSDIWIFSGRSDAVRTQTDMWLRNHTELNMHDISYQVRMRKSGDFTPDDVLKESWYDAMSLDDKARLVAVFDDRDRVVAMWRRRRVACFQVAPGEF